MEIKIKASKEDKKALWYEKRLTLHLPKYSLGEEIFSAVVHGVSVLIAIATLAVLLVFCHKDPLTITSVSIYGGSMILLYSCSTMYHALNINRAKKVFQVLDHCAIFLLIAGTYTPITLNAIGGTTGIILFSLVWATGILGIVLNAIDIKKFSKFSMLCYLLMGWVVVFVMKDFIANTNYNAVLFLILGGVAYTLGACLYGFGKKVPYIHSVWHFFVLAGSIFHSITVYQIVVVL